VKLVRARFGDDIDRAPGLRTKLRPVVARRHAEFLKGVGKWERLIDVRVAVHIIGAVELEIDLGFGVIRWL
jgi:hypothetical protein